MKVVFLLLLLFPAGAPAQEKKEQLSLAELARKERERKQAIEKKKKVITNADLAKFQDARVTTAARSASAAPAARPSQEEAAVLPAAPDQQKQAEAEKDPDYWKSAFAEIRLNVKNAVNRSLVLQLRMNNLRNAFFVEDDGNTQAMIQAQLDETFKEMEQNRLEIEEARKTLAALQQEARRAGLPDRLIQELTGDLPEPATITPL